MCLLFVMSQWVAKVRRKVKMQTVTYHIVSRNVTTTKWEHSAKVCTLKVLREHLENTRRTKLDILFISEN